LHAGLALALALGLHVAVFAIRTPEAGAMSAGAGGTDLVSLQAADAVLADLIAEWDRPPVPEQPPTAEYGWQAERTPDLQGERGGLFVQGDSGKLVAAEGERVLTVGPSRGLFALDTQQVVAHLLAGKPLYVQPSSSLYALQVATACQRAAETDKIIDLV
ncbi:MAG: hypothetical protein ACK421_03730, partial [Pseudanabaenaceae cyanobacterium]